MSSHDATPDPHLDAGQSDRPNWARTGPPALVGIVVSLSWLVLAAEATQADSTVARQESETRRPAVAAPNARFTTGYVYSYVDRTRSSFSPSPGTTTILRIDETELDTAFAEGVATLPLTHSLGARGRVLATFGTGKQNQIAFGPGTDDFETFSYGAAAEIFLRDPDRGSLSMGGSFDRLDGQQGRTANEFGASVEAAIFFPDLGSGPVDWTLRFDYSQQQISGVDSPSDVDVDAYEVAVAAGWYMSKRSQLVLGGRWSYAENEFDSEQEFEGSLDFRWLLPVSIPVELAVGGSVGVSSYEEPPFSTDDRLIYGASVGLVFRFRSGPTLIEMTRAYD